MSRTVIRNCSWGYKCQMTWESLTETSSESIRFCNECEREVHRCDSTVELIESVALNRCVNFELSLLEEIKVNRNSSFNEPIERSTGFIIQEDESF